MAYLSHRRRAWRISSGGGGGAIAFVAAAESVFGVTASPTVTYPSVQANDIILVFFQSGAHDSSGTPPSGWTKIGERDGADGSCSVFWKRASGSETSETWTNIFAATELGVTIAIAYRNCLTSGDVIDASLSEAPGAGTAKDISSSTITNNAMIVASFSGPNSTASPFTFTFDNPINSRVNSGTSPDGFDDAGNQQIAIGDLLKETAGTQNMGGDWSSSFSGCEWWIALKPQ